MRNTNMKNIVICPWCKKGKTMSDTTAEIWASCQCNVCQRVYWIDFQTMRSYKARPQQSIRLD